MVPAKRKKSPKKPKTPIKIGPEAANKLRLSAAKYRHGGGRAK